MTGRVNSIQSLGTLDGPGVRMVVFMQGCNLRCGCCHNPDTWDCGGGVEYTAEHIVEYALRFREYFGERGGITLSGGEPLLQAGFVREVFCLCRDVGINTCLDTSGNVLGGAVEDVLRYTDRVLLDIKYTSDSLYRMHVGCSMSKPLEFLGHLERLMIPTTLRQVIIPSINDDEKNVRALGAIASAHACVDGVELLPFRKLCSVKYERMGIEFPFGGISEPTGERMRELEGMIRIGNL